MSGDGPWQTAEKKAELAQAVQGTLRENHRFLLDQHLTHVDFLDKQIATFDQEIARHLGLLSQPEEPGPCLASASSSQAAAQRDKDSTQLAQEEPAAAVVPQKEKDSASLLKRSQTRK